MSHGVTKAERKAITPPTVVIQIKITTEQGHGAQPQQRKDPAATQ